MKIANISLHNHPGVGSLSVNFRDGDGNVASVAVLAGGNGCGKTAILEAVQLAFETNGGAFDLGIIEIELELNAKEVESINAVGQVYKIDPGNRKAILRYDTSQNAASGGWVKMLSLGWFDDQGNEQVGPSPIWPQEQWAGVMLTYLSEANVSFSAPNLRSIQSSDVDSVVKRGRRSGDKLAAEIAQLILDIRAADSEELSLWVKNNPNVAPPASVLDRRFSRFVRAFEYMFPSKRFREVGRENGSLVLKFEEFGRVSTLSELCTGEKQIVFRAGFLLRDLKSLGDSVIMIDEPELSLHPDWQSKIIGFYKHVLTGDDGSCPQILVATHSPFIVHGSGASKVVILEKNKLTGAIGTMSQPSYPSVAASEAVRAFNIDPFLSDAITTSLLVLTEGESDKVIIETAWSKLRPGLPKPFELRPALGARNINITLNDDQVLYKMNGRKVVGLFDFDDAYNQWNGLWKKGGTVVGTEVEGIVRKHPSAATLWGLLIPVPAFRQNFASQALKGESILSIEFLFEDSDHIPGLIRQKVLAAGQSQPAVVDSRKAAFATHVAGLDASRFSAFEPLFQRFEDMLNGVI